MQRRFAPRQSLVRVSVIAAAAAIVTPAGMQHAHAQAFADVKRARVDYSRAEITPGTTCAALSGFRSEDLVEIRAEVVPAQGETVAYCRVRGVLAPEIAFEANLPQKWNGRFYMIGNGGLAGESLDHPFRTSQRDPALAVGFAVAQTNTGHDAGKEPGGSFVMSNPQKAIDYAWRAVHVTATTAKAITALYYGRPVARSYWNSCSNGGRQGLIEAQRFPEDFDGLVVHAPWVDQTGFTIGALWTQRAIDAAPLSGAKLELLASKVMQKCDAIDGLADGVIDDPRRCDFDARRDVPACSDDDSTDACLTAAEAEAINKVYSGPQSGGKTIFPGFMPGSEAVGPASGEAGTVRSGWINFILPGTPGTRTLNFALAEDIMRYLVFTPPRPDWDYRTFDFDRDPPLLAEWGRKANATSTNLTRFLERGGKLLMTYGWADQVLQPLMGVSYYEQVRARYGAKTPDFFRLFMVPGMAHCAGGHGTDRFDPVTALIDWVEAGAAPDVLHAARVVDNRVVRTRPLCPYPQVARYTGSGSIDDAASFKCSDP